MKKQTIIGYLVFDEGRPVRSYEYKGTTYFFNRLEMKTGISLFPNRKTALRVKRFLYTKHAQTANQFDPNESADHKRCFDLWLQRAKGLRISAVVHDAPSVQKLRAEVKP
jgi:hypothetical protein